SGRRPRDRAAARREALLSWAVLATVGLDGGVRAQTPDQMPGNLSAGPATASQSFGNGNPAAAQKAMRDAIPLTPEMIEELGRRFNATQRAREEAVTPLAAPLNRRGGLVVSLEAAQKPITFLLVSGGGRYDANLSIHVADRGPHAKVEIMTQPNAPDTGAPFLTGMLEGVPPADAVPLSVEGVS